MWHRSVLSDSGLRRNKSDSGVEITTTSAADVFLTSLLMPFMPFWAFDLHFPRSLATVSELLMSVPVIFKSYLQVSFKHRYGRPTVRVPVTSSPTIQDIFRYTAINHSVNVTK